MNDNLSAQVSRSVLIWSTVMVLATAAIYIAIIFAASAFVDLFKGFGAELPLLSRIVFSTYQYFGVLSLIAVVPWIGILRNRRVWSPANQQRLVTVTAGLGVAFLMLGAVFFASYLPIFVLGSVVD